MFRHLSLILFLAFSYAASASQQPIPAPIKGGENQQTQDKKTKTVADQQLSISNKPSLPVEISPTQATDIHSEGKSENKNDKSSSEEVTAWSTVALAIITFLLAMYTARLWKATEQLVKGAEDSAQRQLRAYLTVVIGTATYQEAGKDIRFAGRPRLINTGNTPAHKVSYRANAAILPVQLPRDFEFPLTQDSIGGSVIGPNQFTELQAVVDEFVLDSQVSDIKYGKDRVLHIWGVVTYKDIFGEYRETRFCQALTWIGKGNDEIVYGYYNTNHNEAT